MRAVAAGLIVLTLCASGCSGSNPNQPTPNPTPDGVFFPSATWLVKARRP